MISLRKGFEKAEPYPVMIECRDGVRRVGRAYAVCREQLFLEPEIEAVVTLEDGTTTRQRGKLKWIIPDHLIEHYFS